jgi:two-component system cell cycle sensor histidine kinase/response regulator CckA
VISNAPVVLFALDAKGTFTLCEGKGLEAMGLRAGDAVGKSAFELYKHAPQIRMNIRRALSGEEFISTSEMSGLWLETYYSPVFKGYDEVTGVIGVGINVTDRKRAEDALKRSEEQLRHSRKMEAIGRVAGGVAHDFNNLLTAITGYAELLLSGADAGGASDIKNEVQRKNVEEIRNASERATSLTRQLLAFSRRQVLSPKALNLNTVVGDMDRILRRLMRENIDLVTVLEPTLGEIWADPGQLEQVILNLALNARDAIPGSGQLTLETSNVELEATYARSELFLVPGPYVVLAVSDTGMGMDEEVKAHLFEPFFTTKENGQSHGLGLSTVYGIVKQSGGTIVVASEKGRGTTFKVYLPRVGKDKEASHPAPARAPLSDALKGVETVLLVEDEEAVRTLVREILRMHGYEVLEARHGGEAILISQRHTGPIHLLLTDMVMANMSGKQLADHLRPLRPEMRVLYISGYSEELVLHGPGGLRSAVPGESGARTEGVPQDAFLAKPFTPKTLATKVREVLDGNVVELREVLKRS